MTKSTTERQTPKPTQVRLGEVLEAYGANPARWPRDERAGLEAIAGSSTDQAATANALDTLLDTMPEVETSAALSDAILMAVPNTTIAVPNTASATPTRAIQSRAGQSRAGQSPTSRSLSEWLSGLLPTAPVWRPAAAFAALALVGFALVSVTGTPVNQNPGNTDNAQVAALDPAPADTPAASRNNRDAETEWALVFDPAGVNTLAVNSRIGDTDNDWDLMFDPAGGVVMAGYVVGDM
jgi:hypothetical protein